MSGGRNDSRLSGVSTPDSTSKCKFDIWNLIKRPITVNAYLLTARYRIKSAPVRRVRSGVVTRKKRRPESQADSETDIESQLGVSSTDVTFFDLVTDSHEYNEEDGEDNESRGRQSSEGTHSQMLYLTTCKAMGISPTSYILKHLADEKLDLKHLALGTEGVKACAISLVENFTVQGLNLQDNDIGVKGASYVAEMLTENTFITELNLADNNLRTEGVKSVVNIIRVTDNLTKLDLSGNNLQEYDGVLFSDLIEESQNLKELYLNHNCFCEIGGIAIGDALGWNDTIEVLDLSWNHLRRNGATAIAKGLAINSGIRVLNLAWNGFYLDGCKELAKALERNSTLTELDLSSNRINKQCLHELWKGLKKNETLKILRLANNPITSAGALDLLLSVKGCTTTALEEVDLGKQCVELTFVQILEEIQKDRVFKVTFGAILGQDIDPNDDEKQLVDENPVLILMEFGKLLGLRLTDLFAMMDKDHSKTLTRSEIKTGLLDCNIPLSEKALDHLIQKLDCDGDGEIDYGELMMGHSQHRRKLTRTIIKSREQNVAMEDTEVGRIRKKLEKLMAKKKKATGRAIVKKGFNVIRGLQKKDGKVTLLKQEVASS